MSPPISAVLFDCDGVLQRASNDWVADIAALTGLGPADERAFHDALQAADRAAVTGADPLEVFVTPVVQEWGLDVAPADLVEVFQHVVVDQGVLDAARALRRRGVACALGTNQHPERAAYMRRVLDYARDFDPMIISCEIGLAKPDPAYFAYAVDRLGVTAPQVLFVDDIEANVLAARSVGLAAEVFARDGGRPELDRVLAAYDLAEPLGS